MVDRPAGSPFAFVADKKKKCQFDVYRENQQLKKNLYEIEKGWEGRFFEDENEQL